MIAGHTKFNPDGKFGLIKRLYWKSKVNSLEEIREILKKPIPKPTPPPFETKTEEPITPEESVSEPTETDRKVIGEWLYKKEITNDEYVLLVRSGVVLGSEKNIP